MAQRMHGGAALQHVPLATPGFQGLNTEQASSLLGPEWATTLKNAVIDSSNRLAARKGWADQTTTPNADDFVSGFEYVTHSGTRQYIMATDNGTIVRSTDDGATWGAVTGTASFTNGNWQWLNFADKVIGIQSGKQPIVYSGTTFSHISDSSNEPTGSCGTAFAGRLWIADSDGHTMKYSALLDETDWSSADSGSINFQNVWKGTDTIQAIASHNGALVVFGKRNIIFISDGAGAALGIDPANAYIFDTLSGTGCIARDSVQNVDGDLWFLSETGLQSLGRLIQERSNPLENLSKNVMGSLITAVAGTTLADIRSAYSPEDRFYLLSLPKASGAAEIGEVWVFDTRGRMQDGSVRSLGQWTGLVPTVLFVDEDNNVAAANRDNTGELFFYSGQQDDGASYGWQYRSGWTDLGAPGIKKILKRMAGVFFSTAETTVAYKWAFDFEETFKTRTQTFSGAGGGALWGTAVWDTSTWGGGEVLREGKVVPAGSGEYIKFGLDTTISGQEFSVQQLELFAKIGRMG